MKYNELTDTLRAAYSAKKEVTAFVTFTTDSFTKDYSRTARTYLFTSNNKAFMPNASGYSIFGRCLDGTDLGIRLESYMRVEKGGKDGWEIETCGLVKYLLVSEHNHHDMKVIGSFDTEKMANRAMWQSLATEIGCSEDELNDYIQEGDNAHFEKFSAWFKASDNEMTAWKIIPLFLTGNDLVMFPDNAEKGV